jgi:hypothetical protein
MIAILLDKEIGDDYALFYYYSSKTFKSKRYLSHFIQICIQPSELGVYPEVWILNQKLERVHKYRTDNRFVEFYELERKKQSNKESITDEDVLFILGCKKIYQPMKLNVRSIEK